MKRKILYSKLILAFTLLLVLFIFLAPSSSAGFMDEWYRCDPVIEIDYDESEFYEPLSPYSAPKEFPIKIKIKIEGVLQHIVSLEYGNNDFFVDLYIDEAPEWCKTAIYPPLLKMDVSQYYQSANATIALTLDKNSPAFEISEIKIRVVSRRMGYKATVVPEGNKTLIIPFKVGYVPYLEINEIEGNHKIIDPNEVAYFPLELINLGNGITDVKTNILSAPKGWRVDIIELITIDEYLGKGYKKTLNLAVKPPDSFGYHEDRETIEISFTPSSNYDSNITGESHILSFIVHSRGFSTPGFEGIFVILSIIIIMFIIKKRKIPNDKYEEDDLK